MLTGESLPAEKRSDPVDGAGVPPGPRLVRVHGHRRARRKRAWASSCAPAVGRSSARSPLQLGERQPQTAFQLGLRDFSLLLVRVTAVLAGSILVINVVLGRSLLESVLFALAIAVGLTPQLLPAIVTISLSTGAKRLAERAVVVKRLVSIEDLGNIVVLFTDKTGTLTEGTITFAAALDAAGRPSDAVLRAGLLCNDATLLRRAGGRRQPARPGALGGAGRPQRRRRARSASRRPPLRLPAPPGVGARRRRRRRAADHRQGRTRDRARPLRERLRRTRRRCSTRQFAAGSRVIAVATRAADGRATLSADDERDLDLAGFLTFVDRPKADAREALDRLRRLDVQVKVITGDNDRVAQKVCADIGLAVDRTLTGAQLERLDDAQLAAALPHTTIFARVTPEQKSRIIKAQRALGSTVGFLGDGVNDAVALHDADVGISVQTATDVAKDAADIVLLDKDLDILAGGVVEGRRIFANTIKYVLMGTSSNFGNMFSAGGASLFLSFLPMLPTQILLNNLLYDGSEMAIPTDNVDEEQLQRPAHWDTALHPPLHDLLRADQLDLRLRHLRDHDLGLQRRTRRCSAPAGSSSRSRPRAWSSSRSAPAASRSSAAGPSTPLTSPPSPASRSASCCPSPRSPTSSASPRCPPASSPRSRR